MEYKPRRKLTWEFKLEAVRQVALSEKPKAQVSRPAPTRGEMRFPAFLGTPTVDCAGQATLSTRAQPTPPIPSILAIRRSTRRASAVASTWQICKGVRNAGQKTCESLRDCTLVRVNVDCLAPFGGSILARMAERPVPHAGLSELALLRAFRHVPPSTSAKALVRS